MRAVRVLKRGRGTHYAAHWLTDDELTHCGLNPDDLNVVEELELEKLPAIEACHGCRRRVEGSAQEHRARDPDLPAYYRHALPASYGRSSKSGKLRQTGQSGHGSPLRP